MLSLEFQDSICEVVLFLSFCPHPTCSPIHSQRTKDNLSYPWLLNSANGGYSMFQLAWTANLTQHGVPLLRTLSIGALLGISVGTVLTINWFRSTRPRWGAHFPRQVVLGCIRKLAKHKSLSNPVSSVPLRFLTSSSCLNFYPNYFKWRICDLIVTLKMSSPPHCCFW